MHHITNAMVADRPAFRDSTDYATIKDLFEAEDTVVVAHNARFDLAMLKKEGIEPKHHICTLKVARAMDPEGKIQKYNLQFLRYALNLEIDEGALAHSADGDVLVRHDPPWFPVSLGRRRRCAVPIRREIWRRLRSAASTEGRHRIQCGG